MAGNPADIVLVRMISDVNRAPAEQLKYRNGSVWRWGPLLCQLIDDDAVSMD